MPLVDGKPFTTDNVMVQGLDQEVLGYTILNNNAQTNTTKSALSVNSLKVAGLLNEMDFGSFSSRIVSVP